MEIFRELGRIIALLAISITVAILSLIVLYGLFTYFILF